VTPFLSFLLLIFFPRSLPLLKSLDASFNQINTVPEEIGLATALVK
jgi:Leucine-rich repeat (LRR) protein